MKEKKMLVLDIDGTVTNSKKEITKHTLDAILACQKAGHIVVIASGRPTPGVVKIANTIELEKYGGYVLSFNGARITKWDTKEIIYQQTLNADICKKVYKYCLEHDLGMLTYDEVGALTGTRIDEYMEFEARINNIDITQYGEHFVDIVDFPVCKFLLTKEDKEAEIHEKVLQEELADCASVYRSEPFFIEIMAKGIDKAASLEKLRQVVGMDVENIIACGDGFNDLSMIRYAGLGVAMANAQQTVKDGADYITTSNDEDGVAKVIEEFIL